MRPMRSARIQQISSTYLKAHGHVTVYRCSFCRCWYERYEMRATDWWLVCEACYPRAERSRFNRLRFWLFKKKKKVRRYRDNLTVDVL